MKVAYQGVEGAYSNIAAKKKFENASYIGYNSFEEAMEAVKNKEAQYAVIPVENSNAGRVSDVHFLLPQMGLYIVDELFLKIEHQLLGIKGALLKEIKQAYSHPQALAQSSKFLRKNKIAPIARIDTSISCKEIVALGDKTIAAVASKEAGVINNLEVLAKDIHNADNNTTRFLIMARKQDVPEYNKEREYISSFIFKAKNIPASLYKSLGGFATNYINITKIESYLLEGKFVSAQFYIEAQAHVNDQALKNALEELTFFAEKIQFLGCYQAHEYRNALLC